MRQVHLADPRITCQMPPRHLLAQELGPEEAKEMRSSHLWIYHDLSIWPLVLTVSHGFTNTLTRKINENNPYG